MPEITARSNTTTIETTGGGLPGPYAADDQDQGGRTVTVSSGMYTERLPVAESSVAEVRRRLADRLDIDPNALPVIDGDPVTDEEGTRLRAGQMLAFVRHSGEKGA